MTKHKGTLPITASTQSLVAEALMAGGKGEVMSKDAVKVQDLTATVTSLHARVSKDRFKIGELLSSIKKIVAYKRDPKNMPDGLEAFAGGGWKGYVKDHLTFDEKTANSYIEAFELYKMHPNTAEAFVESFKSMHLLYAGATNGEAKVVSQIEKVLKSGNKKAGKISGAIKTDYIQQSVGAAEIIEKPSLSVVTKLMKGRKKKKEDTPSDTFLKLTDQDIDEVSKFITDSVPHDSIQRVLLHLIDQAATKEIIWCTTKQTKILLNAAQQVEKRINSAK